MKTSHALILALALAAALAVPAGAAATRKRTRAGPCGRRRPCSQFCSVRTLMPSSAANCSWERP